jgi:anti-sigma factor RsiW
MSDAPRTVKVRIAVAVDPSGNWNATGDANTSPANSMSNAVDFGDIAHGEARYWITAELPVPVVAEVPGCVEEGA